MTTATTTAKRYDLAEIMKRAHRLAKGLALAFAEALRLSWKLAKDLLPSSLPYTGNIDTEAQTIYRKPETLGQALKIIFNGAVKKAKSLLLF